MKSKLVRFNDGTYGVRRWSWPLGYKFLGRDGGNWRSVDNYVREYCHFDRCTAENLLEYGATARDKGTLV